MRPSDGLSGFWLPLVVAFTVAVGCNAETGGADPVVPAGVSGTGAQALSSGEASVFRVVVPERAAAGELLRVLVLGSRGTGESESLELHSADGRTVVVAEPIHGPLAFVPYRIYLIGLDSTLEAGEYSLVYDGAELGVVDVLPGEYRNVEIPLSAGLTSLRRDYDPRKVAESEILTELVLSRDPFAIYHTGPFVWPLPQETRQSSLFGDRRTYLYSNGERARTIHVGLDLAAPTGTPLVSAGAGIVRMARDRIVTGGTVVIEHLPGVYSLYYHLDSISVEEGSLVRSGAPIGTVGATGLATGPHLHWEVRVGGVPVSPELLTRQGLLGGLHPWGTLEDTD